MTWRSERGSSDYDYQGGWNTQHDANDKSLNDKADLSSAIWKRDSGCGGGGGGCSCGCCREGGGERPGAYDQDPRKIEAGINVMTKILQDLGVSIDLPTLWPKLGPSGGSDKYPPGDSSSYPSSDSSTYPSNDSNNIPSDDTGRSRTVSVSNGDQLTLGGMHGFKLVDKNGMPVTEIQTLDSGAMDAPVEHLLSNGAIYRSRGGWNHDESITWPNGDVVRFSDAGKFQSYEPHDNSSASASSDNSPR